VSRLFAADWVVPVSAPPVAGGGVLVEGERIVAVGAAGELAAAHPGAERIDLPGCVLAPGFVNLHSHIEYAAYAGLKVREVADVTGSPEMLDGRVKTQIGRAHV